MLDQHSTTELAAPRQAECQVHKERVQDQEAEALHLLEEREDLLNQTQHEVLAAHVLAEAMMVAEHSHQAASPAEAIVMVHLSPAQ